MNKPLNEYNNDAERLASINEGLGIDKPTRDRNFWVGFILGLMTATALVLVRRYVG